VVLLNGVNNRVLLFPSRFAEVIKIIPIVAPEKTVSKKPHFFFRECAFDEVLVPIETILEIPVRNALVLSFGRW